MSMAQFGGGRLGGVALSAGGLVEQNFLNMPEGPVESLYLILSFSLKSTGSAFSLVVDQGASAAAEGTDDMDILLNALMTLLTIYADPDTLQGSMSLPQWRTVLGLLNVRDFQGSFTNGSSVPSSGSAAQAFSISICVPYSLKNYFLDGAAFSQGSTRMKLGEFDYISGASLTPSVVLTNGTANVSAYSQAVFVTSGGGTEHDVGNVFQVKRLLNLQTVYDFDAGDRLGLLITTPASTNAASAINVGPYELWTPAQFQASYQNDQIGPLGGAFDITARATPILWIAKTRRFQDFLASVGQQLRVDIVSGLSALNVYDIKSIPPSPALLQKLGIMVGAGGPVSTAQIAPPSGQATPAVLAPMAKLRILPGAVAAKNVNTHATPAALGTNQATKVLQSGALAQTMKAFQRK